MTSKEQRQKDEWNNTKEERRKEVENANNKERAASKRSK